MTVTGPARGSGGPPVSVVVTTYNYAAYLPQAIDSVLAQQYDEYEVIVVDDGSTDDTADVVRRYLGHPQVRYVRRPNGGQASAKNLGVRLAVGEYVAFLDADDVWRPDKLRKQIPLFASRPDVGIVFARCVRIDKTGVPRGEPGLPLHRGWVTRQLFIENFIPFSSSVVRRECFTRVGMFDERLAMAIDYDLWLKVSLRYQVDYCDEILVLYRTGHGHMSENVEKRLECASFVARRFMHEHREAIDRRTRREDRAYSLRNQGAYYGERNLPLGILYHLRSLRYRPLNVSTYKSLARLLLRRCPTGLRTLAALRRSRRGA